MLGAATAPVRVFLPVPRSGPSLQEVPSHDSLLALIPGSPPPKIIPAEVVPPAPAPNLAVFIFVPEVQELQLYSSTVATKEGDSPLIAKAAV